MPPLPLTGLLVLLASGSLSADITGKVTLTGQPLSKDETFIAKSNGCGESPVRTTENWKISPKGELGDVVVWIVNPQWKPMVPTSPASPPPKIEIKQIGCRYQPHVAAVQAGVPFKIINGDPTLHNIRARRYDGPGQPPGDTIFNFGQTYQGQVDERQFDQPGVYTLQCDVHGWMQCWIRVIPHALFAVTGADGAFAIPDPLLLDGDYKIDAWHTRFAQTVEQTLHVKNGSATVSISFDGDNSF